MQRYFWESKSNFGFKKVKKALFTYITGIVILSYLPPNFKSL